jgi:hypothetical protein
MGICREAAPQMMHDAPMDMHLHVALVTVSVPIIPGFGWLPDEQDRTRGDQGCRRDPYTSIEP